MSECQHVIVAERNCGTWFWICENCGKLETTIEWERRDKLIRDLEHKLKSAVIGMEAAIEDGEKVGLKLSPLRKFIEEYRKRIGSQG